jgi:NAD(P)-dependent dehydrogenase (short-subunit alcohol dehydrogenase family)
VEIHGGKRTINVHFKGVYFLTQKLLPLINDGGRIVNISSGLTRFFFPGSSACAAAKGAVEGRRIPPRRRRYALLRWIRR